MSLTRVPIELIEKGQSFMFYPGATRSRDGRPDYSKNRRGLSLFMTRLKKRARITNVRMRVSAVTYDYPADVEEFYNETINGLQPHGGFVNTIANYMEAGKAEFWLRMISGKPRQVDGGIPQMFGKARLVFAEPISISDYTDEKLREVTYRLMKETVVVTDTALVMSALAGNKPLSRSELSDIVNEWHAKLEKSGAKMDVMGTAAESIDYTETLIAPRNREALTTENGVLKAGPFFAMFYRNNIKYHLEKAGITPSG